MKKSNFYLVVFPVFLLFLVQNSVAQKKFHIVTDIRYLQTITEKNKYMTYKYDGLCYGKSIHLTGLYDFCPSISGGLGIGSDRYESTGYNTLPVFFSVYYTPFVSHPKNYIYTNLGYAIKGNDFVPGVVVDFGVGYRKKISKSIDLNFQFGYNYKEAKLDDFFLYYLDTGNVEFTSVTNKRHSLSLGVGLFF